MPINNLTELRNAQNEANDLELTIERSRGLATPGAYGDEMFQFAQSENQKRLDALTREIARYFRDHGPQPTT